MLPVRGEARLTKPAQLTFFHSDIDILCNWFLPSTPTRVSSFGSLQHFRKSAKPAGAGSATKCLDCPMEKGCAYSAKKSESLTSIRAYERAKSMSKFILTLYQMDKPVGPPKPSSTVYQISKTLQKRSRQVPTVNVSTKVPTTCAINKS